MPKTILELLQYIENPNFISDVFEQNLQGFVKSNNIDELHNETTLLGHAIALRNENAIRAVLKNNPNPDLAIIINKSLSKSSMNSKTTPISYLINNTKADDLSEFTKTIRIIEALSNQGANLGVIGVKDFPIKQTVSFDTKKALVFNGITYLTGDEKSDRDFIQNLKKEFALEPLNWFKVKSLHTDVLSGLSSSGINFVDLQKNAYEDMLRTGECPRTLLGTKSQNLENALGKAFKDLESHPEKFLSMSWSEDISDLLAERGLDIELLKERVYQKIKEGCDTKVPGTDGYTSGTASLIDRLYEEMTKNPKLYLTVHENTLQHLKEQNIDLGSIKANARKELENNFDGVDYANCNAHTKELLKEIAIAIQTNPMSFLNMQLSDQSLHLVEDFLGIVKSSHLKTIQSIKDYINNQFKSGAELVLSESGELTPNQQEAITRIAEEFKDSYFDQDKTHSKLWFKVNLADDVKKFLEMELQKSGLSLDEIEDDASYSLRNGSIISNEAKHTKNESNALNDLKDEMLENIELYLKHTMHYVVFGALKAKYAADMKALHKNALIWLKNGNFPQDMTTDTISLKEAIADISKEISKLNSNAFLYIKLHRELYKKMDESIIKNAQSKCLQILKAKVSPIADNATEMTENAVTILNMLGHDLIDNPSNLLKVQLHEKTLEYLSSPALLSQIKKDYASSDKLGSISQYNSCLDYIKAIALDALKNGAELDRHSEIANEILILLQGELTKNPEKIMYFNLHSKTQIALDEKIQNFFDAMKGKAIDKVKSGCDISLTDNLNSFGTKVLESLISGVEIDGVDTVKSCSSKTLNLILEKFKEKGKVDSKITDPINSWLQMDDAQSDVVATSRKSDVTNRKDLSPKSAVQSSTSDTGYFGAFWSYVGFGCGEAKKDVAAPVSTVTKSVESEIMSDDKGLQHLNFMASVGSENIEDLERFFSQNLDDAICAKSQEFDIFKELIKISGYIVESYDIEPTGEDAEFIEVI